MRLRLVIPAYNEQDNLEALFARIETTASLSGIAYAASVVDDGSRDGTAAVAESLSRTYPIRLLRHATNQGLQGVFLTGMRDAVSDAGDDDAVCVLEGDGTSAPEVIPSMLERFRDGADIVIASRYVPGGEYRNFPLKRRVLSAGANRLLRILCPIPGVRDYTIFYRLYRTGPLRAALAVYRERFTSVGGFACNSEMLLRMRTFVRRIDEVPLVYDYGLKRGVSGMKIGDNLISYLSLFRIFALDCETPP